MEIIKRKTEVERETVETDEFNKFQVSLNNYGHLILRFFPSNKFDNDEKKKAEQEEDLMIVLDWKETDTLITFIQGTLRDRREVR